MPSDPGTPIVPIQFAGQWIAWDQTGTRIVASGRTLDEAVRGAQAAGEKEPVFAKAPKSAVSSNLMDTIRIRKKLESDTLHVPELQAWIGKNVEITIAESSSRPQVTPGTGDFAALPALAEEIRAEYDFDAFRDQREYDLWHANDHLP